MTSATIATDIGNIEVDLYDESAPKAAQNFIDLARKGFYDDVVFHRVIPGFVAQAGDGQYGKKTSLERGRVGTGGPGLQVRGRAGQGRLRPRRARDGERRTEHERQPVLHLPPGPDRQAAQELHAVRAGHQAGWTSSTRSSGPRATAAISHEPVAMTSVTIHDESKVKEFTQTDLSKTLGKRRRGDRIAVLLSQPRCPSDKVMGR